MYTVHYSESILNIYKGFEHWQSGKRKWVNPNYKGYFSQCQVYCALTQYNFNLFNLQADPNQQAIQPLDIECVT
jgi:hypothetical protein